VLSTLINAINKGYLKGFPGLTAQQACHHITINDATVKGHMDQTRQGQQTTQPTQSPIALPPQDNTINLVAQEPNNTMTNLVYMHTHGITGQILTDQIGRFPITSNRGHAYLVIFYVYNANFISSVPIKNCTKEKLLCAYQLAYEYLTCRGFKPLLQKMDNETSKDVEDFIKSQQRTLQYTPPDIHCTNSSQRVIRTWKNHFTAGIASLPKSFPIANWCCPANQCNYTVNMLRPCHQNPALSAFEAMEGSFSFDATPMAPPGTEVHVHLKP
jgi:hypothetical protein